MARAAVWNDLRCRRKEYTSGTIKKLVSSNTSSHRVPVLNAENSLFDGCLPENSNPAALNAAEDPAILF